MLYWHHGINMAFSGNYHEYFSPATNVDAVVYLMLANDLIHKLLPQVRGSLHCSHVLQEGSSLVQHARYLHIKL